METASTVHRLSRIETIWTVLGRAHGESAEAAAARRESLERYATSVRRYLLGALRNEEVADDLAQEFAVRFMRGDLHRADPNRGRFRDFVKGVLYHLVADHHRRRKRVPGGLPDENLADERAADPAAGDDAFVATWREGILDRAWAALQKHQEESGHVYYTVLHHRANRPEQRSADMSEQLSVELGKPVTAAWVRQTLHRAREKFADLLVRDVLHSLREPSVDHLEQELIEIGLLEYCRPALEKLRSDAPEGVFG